jgi:hypothetical protein
MWKRNTLGRRVGRQVWLHISNMKDSGQLSTLPLTEPLQRIPTFGLMGTAFPRVSQRFSSVAHLEEADQEKHLTTVHGS